MKKSFAKKIFAAILCACLVLSLSGCFNNNEEEYISGVSFDQRENALDASAFTEYENKLNGVKLSYPGTFERSGNLEIDGYLTFSGDGRSISVYSPDAENNEVLSAEEYVSEILELEITEESGNTKYGKTSGYRVITRDDEGTKVDFSVKGVDGFYRFIYTTNNKDFKEDDGEFQYIMSSIRIDDGIYNRLYRMASRYVVVLEYATSMQYITDANYAVHCLSNYEQSKSDRDKGEALVTLSSMISSINEIKNYEREEDEGFDDYWNAIIKDADAIIEACNKASEFIKNDDCESAKRICAVDFNYDISDDSNRFIQMINAELAEY